MLVRPLMLFQYSVYSFRISRMVTFRATISLPLAYSVDLSPYNAICGIKGSPDGLDAE